VDYGDLELAAEGDEETVEQKYARLKVEVDQLVAQVRRTVLK